MCTFVSGIRYDTTHNPKLVVVCSLRAQVLPSILSTIPV